MSRFLPSIPSWARKINRLQYFGEDEVIGGSSAPVLVQRATVVLNDAQIKSLPGGLNRVEVVPAPEPGKTLMFINALIVCDSSGGFYEYDYGDAPSAAMRFDIGNAVVS